MLLFLLLLVVSDGSVEISGHNKNMFYLCLWLFDASMLFERIKLESLSAHARLCLKSYRHRLAKVKWHATNHKYIRASTFYGTDGMSGPDCVQLSFHLMQPLHQMKLEKAKERVVKQVQMFLDQKQSQY